MIVALVSLADVASLAAQTGEPQPGNVSLSRIDAAEMVRIPGGEPIGSRS